MGTVLYHLLDEECCPMFDELIRLDLRAQESNPFIPLDELIFVEGEFHHLMLNCYIAARTCWAPEYYGMGVRIWIQYFDEDIV
jgi:hypothetical protein